MTLSLDEIRALPKIALHDHLDGGVRPQTVLELASEIGYALPVDNAEALGEWFFDAANSGSLPLYLETFAHTVAVMQTSNALRRVAREFVADQAADGVIYAEVRWAPELHTSAGLTMEQAIEAVQAGLDEGVDACTRAGQQIEVRQILSAMRQLDRSTEVAQLAVAQRSQGVCGFDIAGPEDGFPPHDHAAAFALLREAGVPFTIHAGEAAGVESIRDALDQGAVRLGHGVRIAEDRHGGKWGEVAEQVRQQQIPLEICPTSNLQTGIADSYARHPVGELIDHGFNITVSCDNRLMSRTTLSNELWQIGEAHALDIADLQTLQENAARAAFVPEPLRDLLLGQIRNGFLRP